MWTVRAHARASDDAVDPRAARFGRRDRGTRLATSRRDREVHCAAERGPSSPPSISLPHVERARAGGGAREGDAQACHFPTDSSTRDPRARLLTSPLRRPGRRRGSAPRRRVRQSWAAPSRAFRLASRNKRSAYVQVNPWRSLPVHLSFASGIRRVFAPIRDRVRNLQGNRVRRPGASVRSTSYGARSRRGRCVPVHSFAPKRRTPRRKSALRSTPGWRRTRRRPAGSKSRCRRCSRQACGRNCPPIGKRPVRP